jgi:general secretion pathway protein I
MWCRRYIKKDGFTLLEVMIALAILSIALVAILKNESRNLSLAYESNTLTMASFLALQKLSELEVKVGSTDMEMKGDFGKDFPLFTWKAELRELPVPGIQAKMLRVSVVWKEGEQERVLSVDQCLNGS